MLQRISLQIGKNVKQRIMSLAIEIAPTTAPSRPAPTRNLADAGYSTRSVAAPGGPPTPQCGVGHGQWCRLCVFVDAVLTAALEATTTKPGKSQSTCQVSNKSSLKLKSDQYCSPLRFGLGLALGGFALGLARAAGLLVLRRIRSKSRANAAEGAGDQFRHRGNLGVAHFEQVG